jgi:hypothetical protein
MRLFVRTYKMNMHPPFNLKLRGRSSYRAGLMCRPRPLSAAAQAIWILFHKGLSEIRTISWPSGNKKARENPGLFGCW